MPYLSAVNCHLISYMYLMTFEQLSAKRGEGNGNPFQYSCLENPMDRGAQ